MTKTIETYLKDLAESAHTPYHSVSLTVYGDRLMIHVEGIEDRTCTHIDTRPALGRVGAALGIADKDWIKGKFLHSGSFASVSLPLACVPYPD